MISTGDKTTFGPLVPSKVFGTFDGVNVSTLHHKGVYDITK
jgi:hypothetical protein